MELDKNIEDEILIAAERVFINNGFKSATMNMIAKEVGISRTSLNYYFRTKDRLYSRLLDGMINKFVPRLGSVFIGSNNIYEIIDHWVEEYTKMLIERPEYPFFIITEVERNHRNIATVLRERFIEFNVLGRLQEVTEMQFGKDRVKEFDLASFVIDALGVILTPVIFSPTVLLILNDKEITIEEYLVSNMERNKILIREMFNYFLNEKEGHNAN
ncbi:TetR/AcrR family transcriptional regulator [Halosquirtibacter xylanolyticus]|uniref:TetR/AcrR family transcriptional regulator n=1 Tax=Halosquirtibacter xylanolyticus TaxID=3374599 RepID=UPI0037491A58|nr:TetR/AcrR family transcriptional regulator [Prolixibacteraceae bacterium]